MKEAFNAGRAAWSAIRTVTFDAFQAFVVEAGVEPDPLEKHAVDLYLAAAAAAGDEDGVRAFETQLLSELPRWLSRLRVSGDVVEEVRQNVRTKLLVGPPPKLRQYRAEGPLGAWVRMAAVRMALDFCGADAVAPGTLDDARGPLVKALDPEQRAIRHRYGTVFEAALRDALVQLSRRDRNLLRFHYLGGMTLDAMARTYHVHRATVIRWLASIRDDLETTVRIRLWEESGISPSEFQSLWIAVKSEIDVSLSRLLAAE